MSGITLPMESGRFGFLLARHRGLLMAILVFLVLFGMVNLVSPKPYSFFDFSYMSTGGGTLALAAIGETLVILTGGFDLSVGAVISLVKCNAGEPHAGESWLRGGLGIGGTCRSVRRSGRSTAYLSRFCACSRSW